MSQDTLNDQPPDQQEFLTKMNMVDAVVGQRIRACRLASGMSQADLGAAIGVRFQQVQKYETGSNRVSASRLWAIADALSVDVTHFFNGIEQGQDEQPGNTAVLHDKLTCLSDPDVVQMVEAYSSLPDGQKRAVLAFIRSMANPDKKPILKV
jgi:transcriptional regulator with XRE-family HTH domain